MSSQQILMKKRSEATQTLRAGSSKADPHTNRHKNRQGRLQYTAQLSAQAGKIPKLNIGPDKVMKKCFILLIVVPKNELCEHLLLWCYFLKVVVLMHLIIIIKNMHLRINFR